MLSSSVAEVKDKESERAKESKKSRSVGFGSQGSKPRGGESCS